mmetsp:Transcript_13895/g.27297  ORF Transcript_13895/g.27297 Transcript_13895/m.27297 type:complete len:161 (-) Transcript_13895:126-608(-)|eukprot:CAMPEP_0167771108 /NCGR_PEP_ID=MMETSP0111_2-20121227/87_1 /TAXON_ID=91324 /ORGANISM="Lotharella globosa, Strain CCCM811" /LENGTH=160 /DNA_ID=CAMNT_0007660409 /DNA_START=15 /DNA_END=497 /DNA_ORIENTATION=-
MAEGKQKRLVVVAVDASQYSKDAWEWGVDNIFQPNDLVHVIHVYDKPRFSFGQYLTQNYKKLLEMSAEYEKEVTEISHKIGAELIAKAKAKGCKAEYVSKVLEVDEDDPKEMIVKYVAKNKAAMVVVGTRGAGAMGRAFHGSVSDFLVHSCHCPVVVVKH